MKHPNRMFPMWIAGPIAFLFILLCAKVSNAGENNLDLQLKNFKQEWAVAKYQTPRKEQDAAFARLFKVSDQIVREYPRSAEAQLWHGTALATYAAIKGGVGALKYAKEARNSIETALRLDESVGQGFGHAVLGTIYARAPGWPMSFGNKKVGRDHLLTGLRLSPEGMDTNFYYGDYLLQEGDYEGAREHLMRAKKAALSGPQSIAEKGRLREINRDLNKIMN